jgi:DNA-binding LacI/PurR family transcriptional regulator
MATMQDVANRAGVSIATVSFVVNGTKNVAPETRARIEAAMVELNYRRNVVARALASSRTRIIALLHPVLGGRLGGTVMSFVMAVSNGARARGYDLVLWPVEDEEQMSHLLAGGLVDGVVLMEVRIHDPRVERLVDSSVPYAIIGRTHDASLPYVDIDFDSTVDTAVRHLTDLGHRAIALVDANDETGWVADLGPTVRTETAYREQMARLGVRSVVISVPPSAAGGIEAARRLHAEAPEATAVLLMNEQAGTGLVRGLRDVGLSVPADISIVAVGSTVEMSEMVDPVLTVLEAPGQVLGQLGIDALIDELEGVDATRRQVLLPCTLVLGGSTAPPRVVDLRDRRARRDDDRLMGADPAP